MFTRADLRSVGGVANLLLAAALRLAAVVVPERLVRRRPEGQRAPKVFIGGCPRSGTTWVVSLLRSHPSVISGTEAHVYNDVHAAIVRHGRRNVRLWAGLLATDAATRRARPGFKLTGWVDRRTLLALAVRAMAPRSWSDRDAADFVAEEIFERYFEEHGGTPGHVLVEKTPANLRFADEILRQFPEAKFVEVLRDGRDVCVSITELDRPWTPDDRREQVALWRQFAEAGLALRARRDVADRVLLVRFEDVHADPAGQLRRLWAFAGLEDSPELVDDVLARTAFDNAPETGSGKFRRKGVAGDWVNHFTPADEELFRQEVGDVFEAAGYRW